MLDCAWLRIYYFFYEKWCLAVLFPPKVAASSDIDFLSSLFSFLAWSAFIIAIIVFSVFVSIFFGVLLVVFSGVLLVVFFGVFVSVFILVYLLDKYVFVSVRWYYFIWIKNQSDMLWCCLVFILIFVYEKTPTNLSEFLSPYFLSLFVRGYYFVSFFAGLLSCQCTTWCGYGISILFSSSEIFAFSVRPKNTSQ